MKPVVSTTPVRRAARILGLGHYRPGNVDHQRRPHRARRRHQRRVGAAPASASSSGTGPTPTRPSSTSPSRPASKALAASGVAGERGRPRHRRHLHHEHPRPGSRTAGRPPPGHRRPRRVRPQLRLRRFRLRAERGVRGGAVRAGPHRAGRRRRAVLRLAGHERPHVPASSSADGAGRSRGRAVGHQSGIGPVVWGSDGEQARRRRPSTSGTHFFRQEGQAVYRWATGSMAPVALEACERAGVDARGHRGVRAAPGQPAHHRRPRPAHRDCRTRSWPATS